MVEYLRWCRDYRCGGDGRQNDPVHFPTIGLLSGDVVSQRLLHHAFSIGSTFASFLCLGLWLLRVGILRWCSACLARFSASAGTGLTHLRDSSNLDQTRYPPSRAQDLSSGRVHPKPANENEVTTGFGLELCDSEHESPQHVPFISLREPFREAIELGLSQSI